MNTGLSVVRAAMTQMMKCIDYQPKRCTCVNMGENNIIVKTVVERVSVNMGDTNINVKTVVERVSVNMGDRGLNVKTVYEPKTISIMI
jgi:hypothetical protein